MRISTVAPSVFCLLEQIACVFKMQGMINTIFFVGWVRFFFFGGGGGVYLHPIPPPPKKKMNSHTYTHTPPPHCSHFSVYLTGLRLTLVAPRAPATMTMTTHRRTTKEEFLFIMASSLTHSHYSVTLDDRYWIDTLWLSPFSSICTIINLFQPRPVSEKLSEASSRRFGLYWAAAIARLRNDRIVSIGHDMAMGQSTRAPTVTRRRTPHPGDSASAAELETPTFNPDIGKCCAARHSSSARSTCAPPCSKVRALGVATRSSDSTGSGIIKKSLFLFHYPLVTARSSKRSHDLHVCPSRDGACACIRVRSAVNGATQRDGESLSTPPTTHTHTHTEKRGIDWNELGPSTLVHKIYKNVFWKEKPSQNLQRLTTKIVRGIK